MTTLEILKAARAKIERPECWTKGAAAVNKSGAQVRSADPKACRWCLMGAVFAVAQNMRRSSAFQALEDAAGTLGLPDYNDAPKTTHADILALYDRAIAKEGGAE